jgi:hypothetical protein
MHVAHPPLRVESETIVVPRGVKTVLRALADPATLRRATR